MVDSDPNPIIARFTAERPAYEAFTRSVSNVISTLAEQAGVDILPPEHRTKDISSLKEKIERTDKADKYKELTDVTDLSGVRIITYLKEDSEALCRLLRDNFQIDERNSTNKEDVLDPDRLGYISVHLIASYSPERLKLSEFKRFKGMKAEVQVRTLLQHTWAALDWKLRYKSRSEVPKPLRRRLYRMGALLEAADDEFSYVSKAVRDIRKSYERSIERGNLDVGVDRLSLELFVAESEVVGEVLRIARDAGFEILEPPPTSPVLTIAVLQLVEVETLADLDRLLRKALPTVSAELKKIADVTVTTAGGHPKFVPLAILRLVAMLYAPNPNLGRFAADRIPFPQAFRPIIAEILDSKLPPPSPRPSSTPR